MPDLSARDVAFRLAGAVGAGVGVLGFVTLVGGAIYWERYSSVGLPSDEILADLSRSQLLVFGVREMLPFAVVLVVEAILLYLVEAAARGRFEVGPLGRFSRYAGRPDTPARAHWVLVVRITLTAAAVPLAVVVHLLLSQRSSVPSVALVTVAAALLAAMTLLSAARSAFAWFLMAALVSTGVFGLVSSASRSSEAPAVRPAALIVDGRPFAGLFISASSDEVYVGEVCAKTPGSEIGDPATGLLTDIPRKDVSAIIVGNSAALEEAIVRERSLLASLVTLHDVHRSAIASAEPRAIGTSRIRQCTGPSD